MSHNRDLSAAAAQLGFHSSNIGIGSEAPRYPLDVYNGNLLVSGSSAGNIILEDRGVGDSSRPFHVVSSDGGKFVINRSNRNASGTTTSSVNSLTLNNGGNLGLGQQTSPAANIHIGDISNGYELRITANALQFNRSSSSYIDQVHDSGRILFRMGSSYTEAMRITSDGKIGINETSPDRTLHVKSGATDTALKLESTDAEVSLELADNTGSSYIGGGGNYLNFYSGGNERVRIDSAGNMGLGTNNPNDQTSGGYKSFTVNGSSGGIIDLRRGDIALSGGRLVGLQHEFGLEARSQNSSSQISFYVNNAYTGRWTVNGLCFGNDTAAANALDDYEEGTSTVSLQNMTADTNQVLMKYTKIGNVVCIVGVITLVNITVSSGSNAWFHLPFAPSHHSTSVPGASIQKNSINTGVKYLGFYGANTNMYFMSQSGGYTSGNQLSAGQIGFTVTYNTN